MKEGKSVAAPEVDGVPGQPEYTRAQLLEAKTLGLPKDVLAVVLKVGEVYTKERAHVLVKEFLTKGVE